MDTFTSTLTQIRHAFLVTTPVTKLHHPYKTMHNRLCLRAFTLLQVHVPNSACPTDTDKYLIMGIYFTVCLCGNLSVKLMAYIVVLLVVPLHSLFTVTTIFISTRHSSTSLHNRRKPSPHKRYLPKNSPPVSKIHQTHSCHTSPCAQSGTPGIESRTKYFFVA